MPLYDYTCESCDHKFVKMNTIAERKNGGHCTECDSPSVKMMVGTPALLYQGTGTIHSKTDNGWRDTLKTIKKNNPLGNIEV